MAGSVVNFRLLVQQIEDRLSMSPGAVDEGKEADEETHYHRKVDDGASLSFTQSVDMEPLYGRFNPPASGSRTFQ